MPRQVESRQPQGATLLAWPAHRLRGRLERGVQTRPRGACLTRVPACDPQDGSLSVQRDTRISLWPFPTGSIFKYFPSPTKNKTSFLTFRVA